MSEFFTVDTAFIHLPEGGGSIEVDRLALLEAFVRWRRGDRREALHQLEQALDGKMPGLADLRAEDLR